MSREIRDLQTRILREDGGAGSGEDKFPPPGPNRSTTEAADATPPRVARARTQVTNYVSGPVTGEGVVFGVQNVERP